MKTTYFSVIAAAALALAGCSADDTLAGAGEGRVMLRTTLNGDFVKTRANVDDETLAQNAIIWISNSRGAVRRYTGLQNVPASISLVADHYVAEAWAGDSVAASWTERWFKGSEAFDVTASSVTQVNVTCRVANVAATVTWGDEVPAALSEYTLTIAHSGGSLTWDASNAGTRGYFMLPQSNTTRTLTWTLQGTTTGGEAFTKTGEITGAKPATEYALNVTYISQAEVQTGAALFDVVVNETPLGEESTDVVVRVAPVISGQGFDISKVQNGTPGAIGERVVMVSMHGLIEGTEGTAAEVNLQCDRFTELGLGSNSYRLLDDSFLNYASREQLAAEGISFKYADDADVDASAVKLVFAASLLNSMNDGIYTINISATDAYGKTAARTLEFQLGQYNASTVQIDAASASIWASSATLPGEISADGITEAGMEYREAGRDTWNYVSGAAAASRAGLVKGSTYYVTLSGLKPGTTYEYRAVADGQASPRTATFTTESALQLDNSSFENWVTNSSGAYIPSASASSFTWDSGNHGSITLKKNVTEPATDFKHTGQKSACLKSQFVGIGAIGKFAAGNIYTGKYLATESMDGVIGFGVPFTSRPKALRLWVKYTPQAIAYPTSSFPTGMEADGCEKGKPDQMSVVVAVFEDKSVTVTSDKTYPTDSSERYPAIVATKISHFFDPAKADNVIGFKKFYSAEAIQAEDGGLKEIVLDIDYTRKDVKAGFICVSIASSRWGDYFVGGPSVLYVDDVELIY